jgi:hypothetical protein
LGEPHGAGDVGRVERGVGIRRLVAHHVYASGQMYHAVGGQIGGPCLVDTVEIGGVVHPFAHAGDRPALAPDQGGDGVPGLQRAPADRAPDKAVCAGDDEVAHHNLQPKRL